MQAIARRAALSFPWLRDLQIVRVWAALRVIPGAFSANCHSGVTLAATHANVLAPMFADGALDPKLELFSAKRFDVSATA